MYGHFKSRIEFTTKTRDRRRTGILAVTSNDRCVSINKLNLVPPPTRRWAGVIGKTEEIRNPSTAALESGTASADRGTQKGGHHPRNNSRLSLILRRPSRHRPRRPSVLACDLSGSRYSEDRNLSGAKATSLKRRLYGVCRTSRARIPRSRTDRLYRCVRDPVHGQLFC